VIVVYATAAFVILEAVDIIFPRLNFPDWTVTFVMILLALGFPITLIFSWIFDVTPEGIEKTKPLKKDQSGENVSISGSWRIATYVSVVIIIGLIAFNIFGGRIGVKIDKSLAKSIAVLPLLNLSGETEQEYICVGLTDEIIGYLFKVRYFDEVRSLKSVLPYKDSEKSTTEIAESLRVNYILQPSYKRMGDTLKITAKLIEPQSDKVIWLHDYVRPWSDKNTIPRDIALQIADHLKVYLTRSERQGIQKAPNTNQNALEFLKLAQQSGSDQTTYTMDDQTINLALKAIELESDYAYANALMGYITLASANYGGKEEMFTAGWKALGYVERALELDPENLSAHGVLAVLSDWFIWDYIKAENEYLKTLELEPNEPILKSGYGGEFLVKRNRVEDARKFSIPLLTYTDHPLYFTFQYNELRRLIVAGDIEEARQTIDELLGIRREEGYIWAGDAYVWLEEYDTALYYLELGTEDPELSIPRFQACLALAYHKTNDHPHAQTIVQQLKERSDTTSAMSPAFYLGWYYSGIGEVDSAFYWLEKAYRNRSPEMPWLKVDPIISNLKSDDRYWDLYERTGHKAYDDYMASKNK